MRDLAGKNAIVTGANRGLGKAIVKELAVQGCNVWAIFRHESEEFDYLASKLEAEYSVFVRSIIADLSSEESIRNGYKLISVEKKTIDILINNAGIGHMGLFQMTKTEFIRDLYAVNLFAPMILTQLVLRNMSRQKSGQIINVASTAASEVYEGNSIYGSSKSALIAFTQSLAAETFKNGIRVNAIAPGLINTDMSSIFEGGDPEEPIRHTALGRKIEAKEIADIVIDLLSERMKLINGAVVTINGGHR